MLTRIVFVYRLLPLCFQLMDLKDHNLRDMLIQFIIKNISKNKLYKSCERVQLEEFFLKNIHSTNPLRQRRILRILIHLYQRHVWRDHALLINAIAECCLSTQTKAALVAIHFVLGDFSYKLLDDDSESDTPSSELTTNGPLLKKRKGLIRRHHRQQIIEKRKKQKHSERDDQSKYRKWLFFLMYIVQKT